MCVIKCSEDAVALLRPSFGREFRRQESFSVLLLDAKNQAIGRARRVSLGTANSVGVHPRDVFRLAIARNACAIIVGHNHPSGDVQPSEDDRLITQRLKEAGALLGIPVLDHIIVGASGDGEIYSFADALQL
jgi:DNA repair protein RadC